MNWNLLVQAVDAIYFLVGCLLKFAGGQAQKQCSRYRSVFPCQSTSILPPKSWQDNNPGINLHWKNRQQCQAQSYVWAAFTVQIPTSPRERNHTAFLFPNKEAQNNSDLLCELKELSGISRQGNKVLDFDQLYTRNDGRAATVWNRQWLLVLNQLLFIYLIAVLGALFHQPSSTPLW